MGDKWQVEAVREHFSVLNSSRNLQKQHIDTTNVRNVVETVRNVLKEHLQPKTNCGNELVRDISLHIIKQHSGVVKFGFIVIVTDRKEKIPIFVIEFGNEKIYIDIKCFTYKSWSAFLRNTNLVVHDCKFSYPNDGHYRVDGRLQVTFASCAIKLYKFVQPFIKWGLAIAGLAATVLFNTVPLMKVCSSLMSLAVEFLPSLDDVFTSKIYDLLQLIQNVKSGNKTMLQVIPSAFITLRFLHTKYNKEIIGMTNGIKEIFQNIWMYIKNMFSSQSDSTYKVPTRFLAIASTANDDYVSNIFGNCKPEGVYHYNTNKKSNDLPQDLAPITKSMLCLTDRIVNENRNRYPTGKKISENDVSSVFLSLQGLLNKNFEEKFKFYQNSYKAAVECAGRPIDIDTFNRSLGIVGDPKNHFLMESLKSIDQSPMYKYLVYEQSLELKEREPVLLIPCMQVPDLKKLGLYRVIGRGQDFICAKSFVKELSEMFNIEEKNFVEKEERKGESLEITLCFGSCVAMIWQNVKGDNDVEGMMLIFENPSQ